MSTKSMRASLCNVVTQGSLTEFGFALKFAYAIAKVFFRILAKSIFGYLICTESSFTFGFNRPFFVRNIRGDADLSVRAILFLGRVTSLVCYFAINRLLATVLIALECPTATTVTNMANNAVVFISSDV